LHGERFFLCLIDPATGRSSTYVTPLFLALAMVEIVDVDFTVDRVPAIFAITKDPFIVYTSNIFATLGLRAPYFALAVLLIFIGSEMFVADLFGLAKFPPIASLSITFAILAAGVGWSLWKTREVKG